MSEEADWNLLAVLKKTLEEMSEDEIPPKLVTEIYNILQKHQYKTNRERAREPVNQKMGLDRRRFVGGKICF